MIKSKTLSLIFLLTIISLPDLLYASKVAILPFKNISGDRALEQLSEGMAEAISVELLKMPFVNIIPRGETIKSLTQYSKEELTPIIGKKVGESLSADFAIIGDYKRVGDKIEVTSSVVQVKDGKVAQDFKESGFVDDIFIIQSRIVQGISGFFSKNPKPVASPPKPAPKPSVSAEDEATYRLMQSQISRSKEDEATLRLLQSKTSESAGYWYNKGVSLSDNSPEEISYYLKAIEIDPKFARAHYNLANIYLYKNMKQEATNHFMEFLKYSEDEADKLKVKNILKGIGVVIITPPESGNSAIDWYNEGVKLHDNSDEEAAYYKKAIEIDPTFAPARYNLGILYYRNKNYGEALVHLREYLVYTQDTEERKNQVRAIVDYLEKSVRPSPSPPQPMEEFKELPQNEMGTEEIELPDTL